MNCVVKRSTETPLLDVVPDQKVNKPENATKKTAKQNPSTSEKVDSVINKHQHILLVEDSGQSRKTFLSILKRLGFSGKVSVAEDGEQAVSIFKGERNTISIIFMDIFMPNKDGLIATKEIRAEEKDGPHVPIICVSTDSEKKDNGWVGAGMDAAIGKLFSPAKIRNALTKYHK